MQLTLARSVIFVPAMLAAAFVLTVYADSGVVLESLPRPLVVAMVVAVAVQAGLSSVLRDAARGTMAATVVLVAIIDLRLGAVALTLVAVVLYMRLRLHRRVPDEWPVVVVAFLALSMIRVVTGPGFHPADLSLARSAPASAAADRPDIFLIMLDGYPRSDTLAAWGYDNGWFEDELSARGFKVAEWGRSNYSMTSLVISTMLHMAHASDIEHFAEQPEAWIAHQRAIRAALRDNPAQDRLSALGYRTISTGMPSNTVTLQTDEYIDSGHLTDFERQVLQRTMLRALPPTPFLESHRDMVLDTFDAIGTVAARPESTFMFAHVYSPHTPFVFDRDGSWPALECDGRCRPFPNDAKSARMALDDFEQAYSDQVHYLNGRILDTLETIPDGAVVVIFSDHGGRVEEPVNDEWFLTFFAARTPGHAGLFPEDARPIEVFPRLLNAYFGDDHPIPADRTYASPDGVLFPLNTELHRHPDDNDS